MKILAVAGGQPATWPETDLNAFDYYVGIDRGCLYLLEQELPLDLAVGDFDSLTTDERARVVALGKIVKTSVPEKDDTDTQLALAEVFERYPQAEVTLIGATGGRLDHLMAVIYLGVEPRFLPFNQQLKIKDRQNSLTYLNPGQHKIEREVEMKYLAYCCLTPVQELTLTKSKYTLDQVNVLYPTSYASNEFLTKEAAASFKSGVVAVIQSRDQ